MALFYNQPLAHRFGTELVKELETGQWQVFETAVAWVRQSGTRHIIPALEAFLKDGGVFRATIGIDVQHTSIEGLNDLLNLAAHGTTEIYVYHDEADTVFHPKVYLFHNNRNAKLVVGSNNLTESGLYVNSEAGLEVTGDITDDVMQDAISALSSWRYSTNRLALPLSSALIADLAKQGYALSEKKLNLRTRLSSSAKGKKKNPLFGSTRVKRPVPPVRQGTPKTVKKKVLTGAGVGRVLIMRARKANLATRPTQTQLPIPVYNDALFQGVASLTSSHDGRKHSVSPAMSRGNINTLKLEIPEMRAIADPVIRFERTANEVVYEVYDSNSILGRPLMAALERGLVMNPRATFLTKPGSPASSTWWRFI